MKRVLIVNADDFGVSRGVNDGVARAHEHGIVTSASLMVRGMAAAEAAEYALAHPELSVGLHVDLGEWAFRGGTWRSVYAVTPNHDQIAVQEEVARQLERFRELVGVDPTHLDSHQHVHRDEPARSVLRSLAARLGVPLRGESLAPRYCGEFYGQTDKGEPIDGAVGIDSLLAILRALSEGRTELACHPAAAADVDSVYLTERVEELRSLCDPRARGLLYAEQIELRGFR